MPMNRVVLRIRKGRPGVGRRIASLFGGEKAEVTCNHRPILGIAKDAIIINYGRSTCPIWFRVGMRWVNHPNAVAISSDKILSFQALDDAKVPTLEWTLNYETAHRWVGWAWKKPISCLRT